MLVRVEAVAPQQEGARQHRYQRRAREEAAHGPGGVRRLLLIGAEAGELESETEAGRVAIDVAVVDARPADATATDSLLALEARDGSALSIARALGRLPAYAMIARRYRRVGG